MSNATNLTRPAELPDELVPYADKPVLAGDGTRFYALRAVLDEHNMFNGKPAPRINVRCVAAEDGLTQFDFLRRPIGRGEEFILTFGVGKIGQGVAKMVNADARPCGPLVLIKQEVDTDVARDGYVWRVKSGGTAGLYDLETLFPPMEGGAKRVTGGGATGGAGSGAGGGLKKLTEGAGVIPPPPARAEKVPATESAESVLADVDDDLPF